MNENDNESASFSKYSAKSPTKIGVGGDDFEDNEEGFEDASPVRKLVEEEKEDDELLRKYEEMEADILQYCEEHNCLWEDKEFPPVTVSIYTVRLDSI